MRSSVLGGNPSRSSSITALSMNAGGSKNLQWTPMIARTRRLWLKALTVRASSEAWETHEVQPQGRDMREARIQSGSPTQEQRMEAPEGRRAGRGSGCHGPTVSSRCV